jgi:dolichol kinase
VQTAVQRTLGRILRADEGKLLTGATYVAISVLLVVLLFPDKRIGATVLLFMSVSDALASLVGMKIPSARFLGKSVAGSAAFFLSAVAIALWQLPDRWLLAIIGAADATLIEAAPLRIGESRVDDNLAIPLGSGAIMTLLAAMS